MKHAGVPSSYSCRHISVRTALSIAMAVVVVMSFLLMIVREPYVFVETTNILSSNDNTIPALKVTRTLNTYLIT